MSHVIDEYFGGNFHFVAPKDVTMTLEEALSDLHRVIGNKLDLRAGVNCVDMGCGIGGVMRDLVDTGVNLTGITIAANEVEMGNIEFRKMGLDTKCRLVEGDCQAMPFSDSTQDAAYAIYSLKYFAKLDAVMSEVARILKPHGKFLIYDLIKTERYNENNEEHRNIIEGLEYACGMPSLHTKEELVQTAAKFGLVLKEHEDLEKTNNTPYHYCFSHSQLFMWLVESPIIGRLISFAQFLKILPKGFQNFNRCFLSGTVEKIVSGGKCGILSGSEIFIFEKN